MEEGGDEEPGDGDVAVMKMLSLVSSKHEVEISGVDEKQMLI